MGDIADAMLDGDLCQCCGVYMEGGDGYPQTCASCQRENKAFPEGRSAKVQCPICKKMVKAVGLKGSHTRRPFIHSEPRSEAVTEAVIGQFYRVPAVRVKNWCGFNGWLPVIGPKHSDAEIVKFPWPHWHIDWRFAPAAAWGYASAVRIPGYVYGRPIQCPNNRNEVVVQEGPVDKLMKCKRPLPPYIEAGRKWKEDWVTELRKAFCGTKITNGLCPHRGIPASAMIREGDMLTCPGHGLRFNALTGEALGFTASEEKKP